MNHADSTFHFWIDVLLIALVLINLRGAVVSYLLRRRLRKIVENLDKDCKGVPDMVRKEFGERLDFLSRENAKVIDQNNRLKERLANLGFKYDDN